eukprot:2725262-Amphidinium_carterae.1
MLSHSIKSRTSLVQPLRTKQNLQLVGDSPMKRETVWSSKSPLILSRVCVSDILLRPNNLASGPSTAHPWRLKQVDSKKWSSRWSKDDKNFEYSHTPYKNAMANSCDCDFI